MNNWIVHRYANLARPGCVETVTDFGFVMSGDKKAHTWLVECINNDEPADLTGYTVHGYFIRADKLTVIVDGEITGNVVKCVLDENCYQVPGQLKGALRIENSTTGEIITVGVMCVRISQGSTDGIVDPGHTIPSLSELLAEISAMRTATAAANQATTNANTATNAASNAAIRADTSAGNADTARVNAITATTAANQAAAAANQAAEDARNSHGGLLFSVNPDDGGLDITYTY